MTAVAHRQVDQQVVTLAAPDDFDGFRDAARALLRAGTVPDCVLWQVAADGPADLFAAFASAAPVQPPAAGAKPPVQVPRKVLPLLQSAALHRDPQRFALLYRLLWRMQDQAGLANDKADPDMQRLHMLARQVRHDIHKMRAFVRFREMADADGMPRYVAWFEPAHHILRANAAFFVNRFAAMRWSILTPAGTLDWDGHTLREGPPAQRGEAPASDPVEALWQGYYAAIFNPARLKVKAMLKEMPRKYWHNMPETALIPDLIAGAHAREAAMVSAGAAPVAQPPPASLSEISAGIAACRRCPIGCNGTRAVSGAGTPGAGVMIVGEQPGDCEEAAGRPFIGPAGQVLDDAFGRAGLDRGTLWLTNAVKHIKHELRGKRRLHMSPSAREIDHCRWWLDAERQLVQPRLILALGASAARGLIGRTPSVNRERGRIGRDATGAELWLTVHPSYLLRLDGAARERAQAAFHADLRQFADRVRHLPLAGGEQTER